MTRSNPKTFANAAPNTLFLSTAQKEDDWAWVIRLSDSPNIDDFPFSHCSVAGDEKLVPGRVLWHYGAWSRGTWAGSCRSREPVESEVLASAVGRDP